MREAVKKGRQGPFPPHLSILFFMHPKPWLNWFTHFLLEPPPDDPPSVFHWITRIPPISTTPLLAGLMALSVVLILLSNHASHAMEKPCGKEVTYPFVYQESTPTLLTLWLLFWSSHTSVIYQWFPKIIVSESNVISTNFFKTASQRFKSHHLYKSFKTFFGSILKFS